ncbi:copper amine oxidase N-terminal domain-containing protein [Saccharibacillus alkalitolerans]|uniref:Copper amine oxidase N-terminal domain-containing protein n=1 Tax=Saccharibacillus alkalitolerans TaxID=2705290 RepID=A0ABX0FDG7_9BACL|nr:copper amine oxidase N-terminal domain-containing protein [Saccharibacillus alkalitolerans]NGZ77546.1 copper amine oxidase N-terminal domain-containing protein [Saccharibacillus alkalitolerans]
MNTSFGKKAKKAAMAVLAAALIAPASIMPLGENASAATTSVYINGRLASGDVLVRQGRTYLTLTDLKGLGDYSFRYNKTWRTVTITGGEDGDRYVLTLGSREARRNGQSIMLEAAPLSYENKTMVPVRAAAQLFDADLQWDQNGGRVMITKKSGSGDSSTAPSSPSRPPVSPPGPSGPSVPKPPTPPSVR